MSMKTQNNKCAYRGRPSAKQRRNVFEDLISAVEQYVHVRSHLDITEKEIASLAGTSESMIHYYFGNKEGLLIAMMKKCVDEACKEIGLLEERILQLPGNPTRHIVELVAKLNSRYIVVTRIGLVEMMRDGSKVGEFYVNGQDGRTFVRTCAVIRRLVSAGVYRADINVPYVATAIIGMMVGPSWQTKMLETRGEAVGSLQSLEWLSFITDLLDSHLRVKTAVSQ